MADGGTINLSGIKIETSIDDGSIIGLSKTLKEIASGKDLQNYWRDVQNSIENTTRALQRFQNNQIDKNAEKLIKSAHALQAITQNTDLSGLMPDSGINDFLKQAEALQPAISKAFSSDVFASVFKTFSQLEEKGLELTSVFNQLSKTFKLEDKNIQLEDKIREYENLLDGLDISNIQKYQDMLSQLRKEAEETFISFLTLNGIFKDDYGDYSDWKISELLSDVKNGSKTAAQAISEVKQECNYLLNQTGNSDLLNTNQLDVFTEKLNTILVKTESISEKIQDIIANGVLTKSNQTEGIALFNDEHIKEVLDLFNKINSSIESIREVIADVGDGEEFSPLLKMVNNVQEAVSGIKLNVNMDLGSEVNERLNQKISQATARQLEAYRKLFSAMKGTGKTNKEMLKFFEPDESSATDLIGQYKGMIERAEKQFKSGRSNIYKKRLGSEYDDLKREITNANRQLSRAENSSFNGNILGELFGSTNLTEVIDQLGIVVEKLDEISVSAKNFPKTLKDGLNISTSVEEINTLTDRVKELEEELSKIKSFTTPMLPSETNISSDFVSTDAGKTKQHLDSVAQSAEEAKQEIKEIVFEPNTENFDDVIKKFDVLKDKAEQIVKIIKTEQQTADGWNISYNAKLKDGTSYILGESSNPQVLKSNEIVYDAKAEQQESKRIVEENIRLNKAYYDSIEEREKEYQRLRKQYQKEGQAQAEAHAKAEQQEYNNAYNEAVKINNALNETNSIIEKLSVPKGFTEEFDYLNKQVAQLQEKLKNDEISVPDYNKQVKSLTSDYSKDVDQNQSSVNSALKQQISAWKNIQSIREKIAKTDDSEVISLLQDTKKSYQEQYIEAGKVLKANQDLYDSEEQINKLKQIQLETTAKITKYKKDAQAKDTKKEANDLEKYFDSIQSVINNSYTKLDKYRATPKDFNQSDDYKAKLNELSQAIKELEDKKAVLSNQNTISQDDLTSVDKLKKEINDTTLAITSMTAAEKGSTKLSRDKLYGKIGEYLSRNTGISKDFREELKKLQKELTSRGPNANVADLTDKFFDLQNRIRDAGQEGKKFWDVVKEKAWYGLASTVGTYFGLNDFIQYFKEGIEVVREFDTALTEMRKVSDESLASLKRYQKETFDVANTVGTTAVQIQNSTADWLRLGYSIDEAAALAKNSNIYKNVGDMEIDEATEHMISSVQAWKSEFDDNVVKTSEAVIDRYNKIGKLIA